MRIEDINRLASYREFLKLRQHPHYINLSIRINGEDKIIEGDWLKYIPDLFYELQRARFQLLEMQEALEGCNELFDNYGFADESPCVRDREIIGKMLKALSHPAVKQRAEIEQAKAEAVALLSHFAWPEYHQGGKAKEDGEAVLHARDLLRKLFDLTGDKSFLLRDTVALADLERNEGE